MRRRNRYGVRTYVPLAILRSDNCRKEHNGNDPIFMFQLGYEVGKAGEEARCQQLEARCQRLLGLLDRFGNLLADGD